MSNKAKYELDSVRKDAWLHGMAEAALLFNARLNKYNFNIYVENQIITLLGEVNTHIDEWLCLEILQGIKEVKHVTSQLTVVELEILPNTTQTITSRQAFLHWYTDVNTTADVKAKLQWNSKISGKEIEVFTENGVVTLSGVVDYKANKALAELITTQITQVIDVKNKIEVNG